MIFGGAVVELSGWSLLLARGLVPTYWCFGALQETHELPVDLVLANVAGFSSALIALGIMNLALGGGCFAFLGRTARSR